MAIKPIPPSPAEVEELAQEYRDLEAKIDEIETQADKDAAPHKKRLDEVWELLVAKVRKFGSAHAEKSKLLYGVDLEVMGTFGSSSANDAAAVEAFRLELIKARQARMLKRIFEKSERWDLLPEASDFLRAEHDKGRFPTKLFLLYGRCIVTKHLTPKLVVRPRTKAAGA